MRATLRTALRVQASGLRYNSETRFWQCHVIGEIGQKHVFVMIQQTVQKGFE